MMKIMADVSAVCLRLSSIPLQLSDRWASPTSSMAMAPTAAPSVGVNIPP